MGRVLFVLSLLSVICIAKIYAQPPGGTYNILACHVAHFFEGSCAYYGTSQDYAPPVVCTEPCAPFPVCHISLVVRSLIISNRKTAPTLPLNALVTLHNTIIMAVVLVREVAVLDLCADIFSSIADLLARIEYDSSQYYF
jgi:hypothetical protein